VSSGRTAAVSPLAVSAPPRSVPAAAVRQCICMHARDTYATCRLSTPTYRQHTSHAVQPYACTRHIRNLQTQHTHIRNLQTQHTHIQTTHITYTLDKTAAAVLMDFQHLRY
jgi:hypothetical protein